ncbi:MAG TPA: glycosyltransferase family 39 protein, partial [Gemmatimonadaceae bacterium]|nr:glycosyltransferase family 39 protein [Gemmatimonadaceae bacterium]
YRVKSRARARTPYREARRDYAPLIPDFAIALAVVTVAAAVRLILAATVPLVPDESYYWEWSRRLASGYFDHPGAIAHLIHAGTAIAGVTPLGVRIGAVAAGWLTSLSLVLLARRLSDDAGALRAAVIITCMPLAAAGLVLATPDAPLLLATAATLLFLDLALTAPLGSRTALGWWLAAGATLGLAFGSKYNAVLLPVGVLVAMLVFAPLRRQLATPAPYLAGLLALLIFTPVIAWNAGHDWISFHFQLSHGLGHGPGTALRREAALIGSQLGLVSPILFVLLLVVVYRALGWRVSLREYHQGRHTQLRAARRALLASVAATTFLFFCWSALSRRAEPNWQAMAYVPAIALLASYGGGLRWRRWLGAGCALGATMVAVVYLQATSPFLPIGAGSDPAARGSGWNVLASRMTSAARTAASDADTRTGSTRVWFAGNRYQDASEIAFHLPSHPEVFSLNIASRPNEYDLWPSFAERARPGDDLVIALIPPAPGRIDTVIAALRPHFDRATHVERLRITDGADLVRDVWVLEGWRGE